MIGQCLIEHYLSVTNVQAEFAWSLQISERTIYQEEEQDNWGTEPFCDTDFQAIQRHIMRQVDFFEINGPFAPVSRNIGRWIQLLSFFRYIMQ